MIKIRKLSLREKLFIVSLFILIIAIIVKFTFVIDGFVAGWEKFGLSF
ncbi:MAG: hypothetical protein U9R54_09880 [Bacteroidota bacterium]|nr:hypothetical protein [Bacteroidota bacterium]